MKGNKIREYKFEGMLAEKLRDKEFRDEYESLEKEFALAEEVIKLRIEKHMTQKELAEIAGTSQPAIARLESGKYSNISLSFLRKIGKALDVEPEIHFKRAE
ncbi:MAG: helix-turn-helix domain-containing protein [Treponema sp.]|jgi:DNA-binding Xre family transcriptional regulator|nr:helix-turn-helix domain-containing protein [Treponema sp.]